MANKQEPPSLYAYYSEGGIQKGLEENGLDGFLLNGKPIQILSGSVHYFRVHPEYWRSTIRKMKACGLNAVET
jgi:beta-galactosidase